MCGCMLMHAVMDHGEHQSSTQPTSAPRANVMPAFSGRQCVHCGFSLQQGFAFCPNCGMRLQETKCPACGQITDATWKTCAYCGSPLGQIDGQRLPA
jgi:RNA polymerase subunit RPABC4/transcription elongation factor Spt4